MSFKKLVRTVHDTHINLPRASVAATCRPISWILEALRCGLPCIILVWSKFPPREGRSVREGIDFQTGALFRYQSQQARIMRANRISAIASEKSSSEVPPIISKSSPSLFPSCFGSESACLAMAKVSVSFQGCTLL